MTFNFLLRRCLGTCHQRALPISRDFTLLPNFFSLTEQRVLLTTALQKLDAMDSIQSRRRRKITLRAGPPLLASNISNPLHDCFFPDEYYQFEEVLSRYG
jgi:alkylated DNA repair protein alkB family protein 7